MGMILLSPPSLELPDPFLQALLYTKDQFLASLRWGWWVLPPQASLPLPCSPGRAMPYVTRTVVSEACLNNSLSTLR